LTAVNQAPQDELQGYSAGAVDYLSKPFEPWVLRSKVAVFLDIYLEHKRIEELSRQLAALEARRHHALELNESIVQGLAVAKLLLVDDRLDNLVALEETLRPLGQDLVKAHSGEEALRWLLAEEFAVILLDVQMPGMDGFDTAAQIKQRERSRHIPIIFITAISREVHQQLRGYEMGAVDYITKPFDPWVLRSKVAIFVDLYN